VQPFTLDQAIIAGLLFLLGILIGMYFLAGGKWKRLYRQEVTRREALEAESEQLRRDAREQVALRRTVVPVPPATPPVQAVAAPMPVSPRDPFTDEPPLGGPYRANRPREEGPPDIVIKRP